MWRALFHPVFPLAALLTGAGLAVAGWRYGLGGDEAAFASVALGAGAAILALRNWRVEHIERRLLAEELDSLHDALDEVAEAQEHAQRIATADRRSAAKLGALERRLGAVEADLSARREAEAAAARRQAERFRAPKRDARRRQNRNAEPLDEPPRRREPPLRASRSYEPSYSAAFDADAAPYAIDPLDRDALEGHRAALAGFQRAHEARREADMASRREADAIYDEADAAIRAGAAFDPTFQDERYELLLQAVYALSDREPRYFEAVTRAWVNGEILSARASHVEAAKLGGYVDVVDNMALVKSVEALRVLRNVDPAVSLFCNISMQTLRSDAFLAALLSFLGENRALGDRLILELSQDELGAINRDDLAILARLNARGFTFSLDHASDWTFKVKRLADIGFRFIKLDCDAAVARERASPGSLAHLARSIERAGLEVVVEKVERREDVDLIAHAGVRLAQGRALSEPRRLEIACENMQIDRRRRKAMARRRQPAEASASAATHAPM